MYSNYKIADLFSSLKIQPQLNIFLIFLCTAVNIKLTNNYVLNTYEKDTIFFHAPWS